MLRNANSITVEVPKEASKPSPEGLQDQHRLEPIKKTDLTSKPTPMQNWSGLVKWEPEKVFRPTTEEGIQAIVKQAIKENRKVRVQGR
jgi:FAD/FMN-containing dehydrogenase